MKKILSMSELKDASTGKSLSAASYLYYASTEACVGSDFVRALADVLDPTFTILDGMSLIDSINASEKYKKYTSGGMSKEDAQYWANLLETTELFGSVDEGIGLRLADVIAQSWRLSLQIKRPGIREHVRIVRDSVEGEVFVVLESTMSHLSSRPQSQKE